MATQYLYASQLSNTGTDIVERAVCDGATYSDFYVEGDLVTWVVSGALGAATDVFVRNFDASRKSNYSSNKPRVVIKCASDASGNNVLVKNAAGSTLYTFAADYSVTPHYVALRLTDAGAWELA